MSAAMKAVRVHEYGGPAVLVYEDAPRPVPGPGEVLIRVLASSVNPLDCAVRAGYMTGYFNMTMPYIPGTDIAGRVEQLGEGVTQFEPGAEVYARGGVTRDGSNAEFAVTSAGDAALKPKSLDFLRSAALPHVTLTAWQALFELAQLQPGQTILIHGAAGGVGHVATQLAKARGATVIGTTSRNHDFLRGLDCDKVIDYSEESFADGASGVDVVLDTVGGETQERSWAALKPGGILVSVVQPPSPETAARYGVRGAMVFTSPPIGPTLAEADALADAGKLRPEV